MKRVTVGLWALWGVYAIAMLATLPQVPFHPDESTHLYLSRDFDQLVWQLDPAGVTWATDEPEAVLRYRLLEAPLSRYLIGLSRTLTGQRAAAPAVDWKWSADWAANAAAGAVPSDRLLWAARLPATLGTVVGALLVFAIGRRAGGWVAGVGGAALYAANGALWLHGRRAMSEGVSVFALLLAVWLIVRWGRHGVALGAAVALAAAAKLTGAALLPAALMAVLVNFHGQSRRRTAGAVATVLLSLAVVGWSLQPALWAAPGAGVSAMLAARTQLLAEQTAALRAAGGPVLDRPAEEMTALLYQLYLAPLAYWEVPNYAAATAPAEAQYQARPWHRLFRAPQWSANLPAGALLLGLTLIGLAVSGWRSRRRGAGALPPDELRARLLLAVATLGLAAALLAVPIAWQRYYVPLLPLVCVWSSLGLAEIMAPLTRRWSAERGQA